MHLHANRQEMQAKLTGNVQFTKNHFLQIIPLALKNPVMAFSYKLVGRAPLFRTYTNPGAFPGSPEMEPHIQRMEVMLGQATAPPPLRLHQLWQTPWPSPLPAPESPVKQNEDFLPFGPRRDSRESRVQSHPLILWEGFTCLTASTAVWSWTTPPRSAHSATPQSITPTSQSIRRRPSPFPQSGKRFPCLQTPGRHSSLHNPGLGGCLLRCAKRFSAHPAHLVFVRDRGGADDLIWTVPLCSIIGRIPFGSSCWQMCWPSQSMSL